jgi:hypothetical protein
MANNNSTVPISAVQNVDQPFTELFDLLPQLNNTNAEYPHTEILRAIETHSSNAAHLILNGIQSLGALLALAAEHDDNRLTQEHIINTGWLTHALGNLLEGCVFINENLAYATHKQEMLKS